MTYTAHPSAIVDPGAVIGDETRIWHWVHVSAGARIGSRCSFGQGVFIGNVTIGNGVKIQNNVSVYDGVEIQDEVFCGPSMVFTNVINPRSHIVRKSEYRKTLVGRRATIGANATIVCGVTIGAYALIGAGAVITRNVPAHAVMIGVPGRRSGWVCACGVGLKGRGTVVCTACAQRFAIDETACIALV